MKQPSVMKKHGSWKAEENITRTGNISSGVLAASRCQNHKAAMRPLTHSLPELLGKIALFLLVTHYLLLERSPGNGAIFVLNSNNLMNPYESPGRFLSYCQGSPQHQPQPEYLSTGENSKTSVLTSRGKFGALKT